MLKFQPILTTLILLGINLAIAAVIGVLAARSTPSHTEQEALEVRQRVLEKVRRSLVFKPPHCPQRASSAEEVPAAGAPGGRSGLAMPRRREPV